MFLLHSARVVFTFVIHSLNLSNPLPFVRAGGGDISCSNFLEEVKQHIVPPIS